MNQPPSHHREVLWIARRVFAQALHPPVRERPFWVVQISLVALAGMHLYLDAVGGLESTQFPTGLPVALLLAPVLYSALRYAVAGAAATALWATLLWLPDLLLPNGAGHAGSDAVELVIVVAAAVFAGVHIEREDLHRSRAEQAESRERAAMHSYAARLLKAQEEERARIAREIHDDPLQRLIHVARLLERPTARAQRDGSSQGLAEARSELVEVIGRLRDTARGLRPPGLDHLGLVAAVRGLVAETENAHELASALVVSGCPARLAPEIELGAFRIIQEAVGNAVHHASASAVRVRLDFGDDQLTLRVHDDGIGFDPRDVDQAGAHLGLIGMQERATLLGSGLLVSSRRGQGTTVEAVIPLSHGEPAHGSPDSERPHPLPTMLAAEDLHNLGIDRGTGRAKGPIAIMSRFWLR